jgi:hypothetical protein
MEGFSRRVFLGVLACLLCREAASSTVSAVTVPLAKAVSDSGLIVVGSVEEISEHRFSSARNKMVTVRYFAIRIEEVLKSRESDPRSLIGCKIAILDPREVFYQEEADLIAAGVISFVDARYPTKVQQIAAGDRLIFFLAGPETARKLSLPDARFLVCGRAYDTLAIKRAVLKQLK